MPKKIQQKEEPAKQEAPNALPSVTPSKVTTVESEENTSPSSTSTVEETNKTHSAQTDATPTESKSHSTEEKKIVSINAEPADLAGLEELLEETFLIPKEAGLHTHSHSGDRLWTDGKCPVCRIKALPAIFESKEQQIKREKENDKLLLTLSLELDKELIRKAREVEKRRHDNAISNSEYNYTKTLQKVPFLV